MLKLGGFLFRYRGQTPIPFVLIMIFYASADTMSLLIGTVSMVMGELIRIIGVTHIGGVSRTKTFSTGQKLITTGPFSFVRNPLYIGNFFLSVGITISANVNIYFTLIFIAFFAFQYTLVVRWEESNLKKVFGKEFEEYMVKVPRWVPAIRPKIEKGEKVTKDYKTTFKSEKNTLLAAITLYILILWRSGFLDFIQKAFS